MALKKEIKFGNRSGNYLKIIGLHSNSLYNATVVRIAVYKDKEDRERDEAGYLKVIPISLDGMDLNREQAYKALKLKGQFEGSSDC